MPQMFVAEYLCIRLSHLKGDISNSFKHRVLKIGDNIATYIAIVYCKFYGRISEGSAISMAEALKVENGQI